MDDRRAITQASKSSGELPIIRTEDLIVDMIKLELLTVEEADAIKDDWSNKHRFTLAFDSFGELL